jgi:putative FmdB family regulatory protein
MPTYEYRCPNGHTFEKLQKMTEKPKAKCPTCGKVAERMISGGAGLVFKGTGFYITDYGKDGKGPRKPPSETPATSETKTEPKVDLKPDSKKETKPAADSKSSKKNRSE